MATSTGPIKLILPNGQRIGCVAGTPLESASGAITEPWRKKIRKQRGGEITFQLQFDAEVTKCLSEDALRRLLALNRVHSLPRAKPPRNLGRRLN
jgi:hypothetical protein